MVPVNPLSSTLIAFGMAVALLISAPTAAQVDVTESDCAKIPDGNAPVEVIGRLKGGMSVRNLEFTYFGKSLHRLTENDYDTILALWKLCGTYSSEVAESLIDKLEAMVDDAKVARRESLTWIEETKEKAAALKPGHEGIVAISNMWQEMLNREFEMLRSDLNHLAGHLEKRQQELYSSHEKHRRVLVAPFDPGPPVVRDLGG